MPVFRPSGMPAFLSFGNAFIYGRHERFRFIRIFRVRIFSGNDSERVLFIIYSEELEKLLIIIRKMKKKFIFAAAVFLIGTLIAYPAVDIVIEDIIDRDLPDVQPETEHIAVIDYVWFAETNGGPEAAREAWLSSMSKADDPPRKALISYTRFDAAEGPRTMDASEFPGTATGNIKERFASSYRELISVTLPALFGYASNATLIDETESSGEGLKYASVTYTNFLDIEEIGPAAVVPEPGPALSGIVAYTAVRDISAFYGIKNTEASVVYIKPLEVPLLKLKLSVIGGFIIALPFISWVFGKELYRQFRHRITIPVKKYQIALFVAAVIVSFIAGGVYAYFLMAPLFIRFLYTNAAASGVQATYSIYEFVSFVGLLTLIFGFIFEFPVVTFVLNRAGIIPKEFMTQYRKHAYVGFFILAALITPPDIISQIIVAIPMIIFFEISILLVKIFGRKDVRPLKAGSLFSG